MITIGQKVYVGRSGSWDVHFTVGEVVKITPSGLVDVKLGENYVKRFKLNGRTAPSVIAEEYGADSYRRSWIDGMAFDERGRQISQDGKRKHIATLIRSLKPLDGANSKWGKDGLMREVVRLQEEVAAIRMLVDGLDAD